ncbi:MAG TPA: phosphate signaling complex protein PhoU [Acidobacteriota bacterium]|nr:phosphate signaling complex protein PhoU [Acidobacteriota bacterium]
MTDHISKHFDEQLSLLKQQILRMGSIVEEAISRSIHALVRRDTPLAEQVIANDPHVDKLEIEIDNISLELLALRQPVARDLRFITTSLKIVKDLERVGDLAVDIAERAVELNPAPETKPLADYPIMAEAAQKMLKDALDAFVNQDVELAQKVLYADDYVDMLNEKLFRDLLSYMAKNPADTACASHLMFVAKYLERVGDHSSNIAEMVIFMVEGRDIRHLEKIAHLKE